MRRCGVYFILNVKTGRHYVGSSVNIDRRWSDHISRLRHGGTACRKLARAWLKYGEDAFYFGVIEAAPEPALNDREKYWIERLGAASTGMNILAQPGWKARPPGTSWAAQIGRRHSPETRAKMSAAHKGRPKSPDAIKKVADALRGRPLAPDHKAKLLAARRNLTPAQFASLVAANRRIAQEKKGIPRPQSVKDKVSESLRAYWASARASGRRGP